MLQCNLSVCFGAAARKSLATAMILRLAGNFWKLLGATAERSLAAMPNCGDVLRCSREASRCALASGIT